MPNPCVYGDCLEDRDSPHYLCATHRYDPALAAYRRHLAKYMGEPEDIEDAIAVPDEPAGIPLPFERLPEGHVYPDNMPAITDDLTDVEIVQATEFDGEAAAADMAEEKRAACELLFGQTLPELLRTALDDAAEDDDDDDMEWPDDQNDTPEEYDEDYEVIKTIADAFGVSGSGCDREAEVHALLCQHNLTLVVSGNCLELSRIKPENGVHCLYWTTRWKAYDLVRVLRDHGLEVKSWPRRGCGCDGGTSHLLSCTGAVADSLPFSLRRIPSDAAQAYEISDGTRSRRVSMGELADLVSPPAAEYKLAPSMDAVTEEHGYFLAGPADEGVWLTTAEVARLITSRLTARRLKEEYEDREASKKAAMESSHVLRPLDPVTRKDIDDKARYIAGLPTAEHASELSHLVYGRGGYITGLVRARVVELLGGAQVAPVAPTDHIAKWAVTIKRDGVPDDTVYTFADPKFIGSDSCVSGTTTYVPPYKGEEIRGTSVDAVCVDEVVEEEDETAAAVPREEITAYADEVESEKCEQLARLLLHLPETERWVEFAKLHDNDEVTAQVVRGIMLRIMLRTTKAEPKAVATGGLSMIGATTGVTIGQDGERTLVLVCPGAYELEAHCVTCNAACRILPHVEYTPAQRAGQCQKCYDAGHFTFETDELKTRVDDISQVLSDRAMAAMLAEEDAKFTGILKQYGTTNRNLSSTDQVTFDNITAVRWPAVMHNLADEGAAEAAPEVPPAPNVLGNKAVQVPSESYPSAVDYMYACRYFTRMLTCPSCKSTCTLERALADHENGSRMLVHTHGLGYAGRCWNCDGWAVDFVREDVPLVHSAPVKMRIPKTEVTQTPRGPEWTIPPACREALLCNKANARLNVPQFVIDAVRDGGKLLLTEGAFWAVPDNDTGAIGWDLARALRLDFDDSTRARVLKNGWVYKEYTLKSRPFTVTREPCDAVLTPLTCADTCEVINGTTAAEPTDPASINTDKEEVCLPGSIRYMARQMAKLASLSGLAKEVEAQRQLDASETPCDPLGPVPQGDQWDVFDTVVLNEVLADGAPSPAGLDVAEDATDAPCPESDMCMPGSIKARLQAWLNERRRGDTFAIPFNGLPTVNPSAEHRELSERLTTLAGIVGKDVATVRAETDSTKNTVGALCAELKDVREGVNELTQTAVETAAAIAAMRITMVDMAYAIDALGRRLQGHSIGRVGGHKG